MSCRIYKILILTFILLIAMSGASYAAWQDDLPDGLRMSGRNFTAGGYSFERQFIPESLLGEFNVRLFGSYSFNPEWKLEFAWQGDYTYFESIGLIPDMGPSGLVDLDWNLEKHPNWAAGHQLDRLNLNYRNDDFTLDIGRQRIAWGSVQTLSFLDMFHPVRPGDPFVPEQPGTDAVRLQIPTGPTAGWEALYAWFDDHGSEAFAVRYHKVHGDFESGYSVGRIRGENFVAFETSGDYNDIGIRLEASWRDVEVGEPWLVAFESDFAPNSSAYISGEVFYNGPGMTDVLNYDPQAVERGEFYLGRWYAGLNCMYNPGGLSTLGLVGIANLSDDSWFADISVQHSLSNSTDLRVGFQHYEGHLISQYGAYPDMFYIIRTSYF